MDIRDVDTRNMLINPKDKDFLSSFALRLNHKVKDYSNIGLNEENVVKYIMLMYDPKSPMHSLIDDYWGKKYECGEAAGFKMVNKKFEEPVNKMLLGENEKVTDMVISFLSFIGKPQWSLICFLNEALLNYVGGSLKGKDISKNDVQAASEIHTKLNDAIRDWLYIKDESFETKQFIEKIYKKIHQDRSGVRPEDYARRISSGDLLDEDNPYGNYKVKKMRFVGDVIPSDEKD